MSIPEWGIEASGGGGFGDDQYYGQGIGTFVNTNNVAYQSYFDPNRDGILPLSTAYPKFLAAYQQAIQYPASPTPTSTTATPTPTPTATSSPSGGLVGDINRDGKVNVFDLSTLLSDWGTANTSARP